MGPNQLVARQHGLRPYSEVWQEMKAFTDGRSEQTTDELWLVEHPRVFTQGQAGKSFHILEDIGIPVVQTDRGGQVTYHGPGQLVIYLLIDIRRRKLGIRDLVTGIEQSMINLLGKFDISASAKREAPGVYVADRKIGALGLRVRKGCTYHGLSLNVNMDLIPFQAINPCGYQGLEVTQLADFGVETSVAGLGAKLVDEIQSYFKYDSVLWRDSQEAKS